jgi:hypothetical protein
MSTRKDTGRPVGPQDKPVREKGHVPPPKPPERPKPKPQQGKPPGSGGKKS